jgi:hypothetical protein
MRLPRDEHAGLDAFALFLVQTLRHAVDPSSVIIEAQRMMPPKHLLNRGVAEELLRCLERAGKSNAGLLVNQPARVGDPGVDVKSVAVHCKE